MAAYATIGDIRAKYGPDLLERIPDYYEDGIQALRDQILVESDPAAKSVLEQQLSDLMAEARLKTDEHVQENLEAGARELDLFIPPSDRARIPGWLKAANIDIAVYYLALSADWRTDEMTVRYERIRKSLEMIQEGKLDIQDEDPSIAAVPAGGVVAGRMIRS